MSIAAAGFGGDGQAQEISPFNEAAGYTLRLGTASAQQEKAEADVRSARATFLPQVIVGAEWVLAGSTVYHPDVTRTDPDSYPTKDPSILAVEASLVVFDGAKRLNVLRAASAMALAGRDAVVDTRQQLNLEAATVALGVIRDRQIHAKRRAGVAQQRRTLQIAREMLVDQSVTRTDVALAAARVDQAESDLLAARRDLEASELAFRTLLGRSAPHALVLKVAGKRLPRSAEEAARRAQAGTPASRSARHVADAARFSADAARSAFYPTVEVVGRASTTYDATPLVDQLDNYTALLRLRLPLFDPTLRPALDRALAEADERRYQAQDVRLQAAAAARGQFSAFTIATAQGVELGRQIDHAEEAVRGMAIEQELGTRTVDDVLDAQSSLTEAEIVLAQIAFERERAGFALLAATGDLQQDDVPAGALVADGGAAF